MKSRNDFLTLTEYKFYLQTYYAGIALNAYMIGPDWKSLSSVENIVDQTVITATEMVKELFNNKTFQHDNRRNRKTV